MNALNLALVYDEATQTIRIGIQNDTPYNFVIKGEITFNDVDPVQLKGAVAPGAQGVFGELPFDQINDYPHFELEIERYSTQGHEETFHEKIKTKPKHFLKMTPLESWQKRRGRTYPVWTEKNSKTETPEIISGKKKSVSDSRNPTDMRYRVIRDLSDLAGLQTEIDLHAEALFDDLSGISPETIYKKQMDAFRKYLIQIKKSSVKRVFIIHGVGSGRLKNDIARVLEFDRDVLEYINEYHPKYGFGATEVVFK